METARRQEAGSLSLLHADPVVLCAGDSEIAGTDAALWSVLDATPERPSYLIIEPSWTLHDPNVRNPLAARINQISQRFAHVAVLVICPTAEEAELLKRSGLRPLHCSEAALVREDLFTPIPGRQPQFDAILTPSGPSTSDTSWRARFGPWR